MPRRGGRVILLERLRWETLLLWLLHVAEEAFGIDDTTFTERAVPYELAMEPHGAMTLERLKLFASQPEDIVRAVTLGHEGHGLGPGQRRSFAISKERRLSPGA
jgi:hypothetical protein